MSQLLLGRMKVDDAAALESCLVGIERGAGALSRRAALLGGVPPQRPARAGEHTVCAIVVMPPPEPAGCAVEAHGVGGAAHRRRRRTTALGHRATLGLGGAEREGVPQRESEVSTWWEPVAAVRAGWLSARDVGARRRLRLTGDR